MMSGRARRSSTLSCNMCRLSKIAAASGNRFAKFGEASGIS